MTLMDRVSAAGTMLWQAARTIAGYHPSNPEISRILGVGLATASGEVVNDQSARTLAAYFACLRVIAEDEAKLPFQVYRRTGEDDRALAPDHPAYQLLHLRPNPETTAQAFRESMTAEAAGQGNAFAEIVRNGRGQAVELWKLDRSRVQPRRIIETGELVYLVDGEPFAAENIFHLRFLGPDSLVGWSVCEMAAQSLGFAIAQQRYGSSFYGNSASPGVVIELPEKTKWEKDAVVEFRKDWNARHQGAGRAHGVGVLPSGWKVTPLQISPHDAEFLTTMQFSVEEICRWFRISPHKIQHLLRSTNNNIEHQAIEHSTDTMHPWFMRWEQEANWKLFTPMEREELYCEHNADANMRGDAASRAEYYRKLWSFGAITINTICRKENLPTIGPEGDRRFVPANMVPLDMVDEVFSRQKSQGDMTGPGGDQNDPTKDPAFDPTADPPGPKQEGVDNLAGDIEEPPATLAMADLRQVTRHLAENAIDRFVTKTTKCAIRASTKPAEFVSIIDTHLAGMEDLVVDGMIRLCRSFELQNPDAGPGERRAQALAKAHTERSRLDLLAAAEVPAAELARSVQETVERWRSRAAEEAAYWFPEPSNYEE